MKYVIAILMFIIFLIPNVTVSANSISGSSAALVKANTVSDVVDDDERIRKTEYLLRRYNSPLIEYSHLMVEVSDNYDLPWTLLTAIAGVESGFCKNINRNSYNCWGWRNGKHTFINFEEAILTVSKTLRYSYFNKGRTAPELIAPIYAPPSRTWAAKVRYFMNLIENTNIPDPSLQITL